MPLFSPAAIGVAGIRRNYVRNDGDQVPLRCTRDGSPIGLGWLEALSLEGRVFCAQFGVVDTAVAVVTSFVATTPSLTIDVPDDIIAIPVGLEIQTVATGAAIFHSHFNISPVRTLAVTGWTGTVLTPLNMRLGNTRTPASLAVRTLTGASTPSTGAINLTHRGNEGDIDAIAIDGNYKWSVKDAPFIPMVEDGGSINLYMYNGTSGTVFAKVWWAEINKEDVRLPQN